MLFLPPPDCREYSGKSIDTTGIFLYNRKVNQGEERSIFPVCVYSTYFIMKDKLSPRERFVLEISHAFAKYGVINTTNPASDGSEDVKNLFVQLQMEYALRDNLTDIVCQIDQLENRYS